MLEDIDELIEALDSEDIEVTKEPVRKPLPGRTRFIPANEMGDWRTLDNGVSYRWGPNDRDDRYVEIQRPNGGLAMVSESELVLSGLRDIDRQLSEGDG